LSISAAAVATLYNAGEYDAPAAEILTDIKALLGDLVEKGYVRRLDA
jgi:hypothetical protein